MKRIKDQLQHKIDSPTLQKLIAAAPYVRTHWQYNGFYATKINLR